MRYGMRFIQGRKVIMLGKTLKKIRHGRDPCAYHNKKLMGCPRVLNFFISLIVVLFFLSGCATSRAHNSYNIQIDQFPEFAGLDGSYISPASIDSTIADVDILALNNEIKSILDESVLQIENPWKRLNALVDVITKNVRYDTQDDKFGTKTAIETFESGKGNCLSFINLFVSAARYAGFRCGYEDIRTPPNWMKNGEALFVTRHIGAFVDIYVPGQRTYTVDFAGNKSYVTKEDRKSFLIAPSLDTAGYDVGSYTSSSIPDRQAFAQYFNNIGSQYLANGNAGKAYGYFVKAIKIDPAISFTWSNLGVAYIRNNQIDAAEQAYLHALSINRGKDDTSAMTIMGNMARLYSKSGRKEDAAFYEKEVVSFRDKNPYYHFSIGKIAFDDGLIEESVKQFKEAIRKKDDEHFFHYALALSYIKLKDFKNAEKSLKKAKSCAWDRNQKDFYDQALDNLYKNVADDQKTAG
jgi:Flp pilus assembly protein TadD